MKRGETPHSNKNMWSFNSVLVIIVVAHSFKRELSTKEILVSFKSPFPSSLGNVP